MSIAPEQFEQEIILWVRVPLVLPERLGVGDTDLGPAAGSPFCLDVEIFVDAMLSHEPVALAGVTGQHLSLGRKDRRNIDVKIDRHRPSVAVDTFERVDVIEVRNRSRAQARAPIAGFDSSGTGLRSTRHVPGDWSSHDPRCSRLVGP